MGAAVGLAVRRRVLLVLIASGAAGWPSGDGPRSGAWWLGAIRSASGRPRPPSRRAPLMDDRAGARSLAAGAAVLESAGLSRRRTSRQDLLYLCQEGVGHERLRE